VVACGALHDPPLLLLHGAQANAAAFMLDAALWSQRFRVYGVDIIGEPGRSAASRPPLNREAHALWLDDVLRGLG
jgi:pimeloyl-ACP methyl ester carboxylesterase